MFDVTRKHTLTIVYRTAEGAPCAPRGPPLPENLRRAYYPNIVGAVVCDSKKPYILVVSQMDIRKKGVNIKRSVP